DDDLTAAPPPDLDLETESEPLDFDVVADPVEGLDRGGDVLGYSEIERSDDTAFAPPVEAELQPVEETEELFDLPPIPVEPDMLELSDETELGEPAQPLDFELVGGTGSMESSDSDLVE